MNEKGLREWYDLNHLKDVDTAISFIKEMDRYVITQCSSLLDHMTLSDLDKVIAYLIETNRNTVLC